MQCLVVQLIRTRKRQISGILKLLYKCHGTWIFPPKFHCIITLCTYVQFAPGDG